MHNEVRIASNRRSEVRIRRGCQSEMPFVQIAVTRLFQRPQHEIAENAFFGLSRNFRDQALIIPRGDVEILAREHDVFAHVAPIASTLDGCETLPRYPPDSQ